jgi:HEAT repeat protein
MPVEALGFESDDEIHDLVGWAYGQEDRQLRISAVFAMGRSQSSHWFDAILAELDSADPQLLIEAVNAAGEAYLAEATPKLRALASHPARDVRLAAVWALAQTRGPGARETLEMCLRTDDEEERRLARDALDEYHRRAELESEHQASDYDDFLDE